MRVTRERLTEKWPVAEGDGGRMQRRRLLDGFFRPLANLLCYSFERVCEKKSACVRGKSFYKKKCRTMPEKSSRAVEELYIVTGTLLYSKAVIAVGNCG